VALSCFQERHNIFFWTGFSEGWFYCDTFFLVQRRFSAFLSRSSKSPKNPNGLHSERRAIKKGIGGTSLYWTPKALCSGSQSRFSRTYLIGYKHKTMVLVLMGLNFLFPWIFRIGAWIIGANNVIKHWILLVKIRFRIFFLQKSLHIGSKCKEIAFTSLSKLQLSSTINRDWVFPAIKRTLKFN